jgi:hypothetical protein
VPMAHCAGVPYKAVSKPDPPSWHAPLLAKDPHELLHAMGGGELRGRGWRRRRRMRRRRVLIACAAVGAVGADGTLSRGAKPGSERA